jgi:hypothetical protein
VLGAKAEKDGVESLMQALEEKQLVRAGRLLAQVMQLAAKVHPHPLYATPLIIRFCLPRCPTVVREARAEVGAQPHVKTGHPHLASQGQEIK